MAPSYGGPRQTVLEFCQESQGREVESEICATDGDGRGRLSVDLGKPVVYEGVRSHFFRRQWSRSLSYSFPMRRWLNENVARFDLVHINGVFCHATYAAALACTRQGVPYVISPHGMLEPWSLSQKHLRKAVAWRLFYRRVMEGAAAIVYSTDQERELTENALNLPAGEVLPAGVQVNLLEVQPGDAFRRRVGIARDCAFLLTLSRIHPKKGLDLLLQTFVELKTQGHLAAWHLVIAGDGDPDYIRHLRRLAHNTPVAPFVHWPGWLDGEAKLQALAEADLFVLSSFQENFGRGLVEAMACGTPVLLSRQVGLAASIREAGAGWITNVRPEEFRQGLIEATSRPTEMKARGAAARELVRREFIWPRVVERTISVYDRVVAERKGVGARALALHQSNSVSLS